MIAGWTNWTLLKWLPLVFIPVLLAGCAFSSNIPMTDPSGLEQLLVARSLERAVDELDLEQFAGRRISVDIYSLARSYETPERAYAEAFLRTHLRRLGANVVPKHENPELQLRIFLSVLGIDYAESLLGLPSVPVPLTGISLPEIALYKSMRSHGYGEIKVYAFDAATGRAISSESVLGKGTAYYTRYVALLMFSFTKTDVFEDIPLQEGSQNVAE